MTWDITADELGDAVPEKDFEDVEAAWPHQDLDTPINAQQLAALGLLETGQLIDVLTDDADDQSAYRARLEAATTRAEHQAVRDARLAELLALRSAEAKPPLPRLPGMNAQGEICANDMTVEHHLSVVREWQFWDVMGAMRGRRQWTAHEYDPDDMMDLGWGTHWRPAVYAAIYGDGPPLGAAPETGEKRVSTHDEVTLLSELYDILEVDSLAAAVGAARAGMENEATLAELVSTATKERDVARDELDALRRDRAMLCEAIAPGTFVGNVVSHAARACQLRELLRNNLRPDFPKPGLVQRLADGDQELEEDVPF